MDGYESWLSSWSFGSIVARLALACLVGVVIGMNREMHSKGAGVKTHVLVCLGSAVTMMVSQYVYLAFPDASADMNRLGAGVVSGVGFLGVGTIIVTGSNEVRGLTTAAGLWASACIGLAVGIGAAEVALVALAFVLFTFVVLSRLDGLIHTKNRDFDVEVGLLSAQNLKNLMTWLDSMGVNVSGMRIPESVSYGEDFVVVLTVSLTTDESLSDFVKQMNALRYVDFCLEV
jgi:putative Mg2+ transporter-C (MgtC) family protein